MSNEYISRDAIHAKIEKEVERYFDDPAPTDGYYLVEDVLSEIDNFTADDVAPVRYAEWSKDNDAIVCSSCGFGMFPIFAWSKCGKHKQDVFNPHFCPYCGAFMDTEKE